MKNKFSILVIVCLICVVSLLVSAEKFNDEIAAIEYESLEDLKNCLNKHVKGKTTKHEACPRTSFLRSQTSSLR